MNNGGYVSKETLDEIQVKLKERSSWWLLDGKLVHCTSWELPIVKDIIKKNL
jgi:hypothetical protein